MGGVQKPWLRRMAPFPIHLAPLGSRWIYHNIECLGYGDSQGNPESSKSQGSYGCHPFFTPLSRPRLPTWDTLHPGRLTWNIIMEVWKMIFLSKWVICRFHVNLPGCSEHLRPCPLRWPAMWPWVASTLVCYHDRSGRERMTDDWHVETVVLRRFVFFCKGWCNSMVIDTDVNMRW